MRRLRAGQAEVGKGEEDHLPIQSPLCPLSLLRAPPSAGGTSTRLVHADAMPWPWPPLSRHKGPPGPPSAALQRGLRGESGSKQVSRTPHTALSPAGCVRL